MAKLVEQAAALLEAGDASEAARLCLKVVTSNKRDAAAWELLGIARCQLGESRGASEALRSAVRIDPARVRSFVYLGLLAHQGGDMDAAVGWYQKGFEACGGRAADLAEMGRLLISHGAVSQAERCLSEGVARWPRDVMLHYGLALARQKLGLADSAASLYEDVLRMNPRHASAVQQLGVLRYEAMNFAAASELFRRVLALDARQADARWYLGMIALLHGDFENGWALYEARFDVKQSRPKSYPQPIWDGSVRPDASLLVYHEQGLGDTIMFCRLLRMARERVGRVVLICQAPLMRLLEQSYEGVDVIVESGSAEERAVGLKADLQVSLLSLPLLLGLRLDSVPSSVPYVRADPSLVEKWRERLSLDSGFKVGISWTGSTINPRNALRSCSLSDFAPLGRVPGVTFYSLQKDTPGAVPPEGMRFVDVTGALVDFADTAALVSQLDLVIAVDTAVVHLAGALERPVWSLHTLLPDYRWMLERSDTPWYPTMRLFRQSAAGDWAGVMEEVASELGATVSMTEQTARN